MIPGVVSSDPVQLETTSLRGHNSDYIDAYYAHPVGAGPYPSVVVLHHRPGGFDEESKEVAVRLARGGNAVLLPNLHYRAAPGADPEDAAAIVMRDGLSESQVVGDVAGAVEFLRTRPPASGKVGLIGFCSGGREALVAACSGVEVDCIVNCWGGTLAPNGPPDDPLTARDIAYEASGKTWPVDRLSRLEAPLLGLFGADDTNPSTYQVERLRAGLERHSKVFDIQIYEHAGHAFMAYERETYSREASTDSWRRIFTFFRDHLEDRECV